MPTKVFHRHQSFSSRPVESSSARADQRTDLTQFPGLGGGIGLICGSRNRSGIMVADKKKQKKIKEGIGPTSSADSKSEYRQDQ